MCDQLEEELAPLLRVLGITPTTAKSSAQMSANYSKELVDLCKEQQEINSLCAEYARPDARYALYASLETVSKQHQACTADQERSSVMLDECKTRLEKLAMLLETFKPYPHDVFCEYYGLIAANMALKLKYILLTYMHAQPCFGSK